MTVNCKIHQNIGLNDICQWTVLSKIGNFVVAKIKWHVVIFCEIMFHVFVCTFRMTMIGHQQSSVKSGSVSLVSAAKTFVYYLGNALHSAEKLLLYCYHGHTQHSFNRLNPRILRNYCIIFGMLMWILFFHQCFIVHVWHTIPDGLLFWWLMNGECEKIYIHQNVDCDLAFHTTFWLDNSELWNVPPET